MATTTDTKNDNTPARAAEQLKSGLASTDAQMTQSVQNLELIHRARLSLANRTVAALTTQYGAKDPRVQTAQASLAVRNSTISRISLVSQQLATPQVQVSEDGWALQGRVVDSQLNPAARFTVFLVDEKKSFLQQYGFSYTDDTGYFLINYSGDSTAPAGAATTSGGSTSASTSGTPASTAAPELFIEVADTQANPVYLSTTEFQPSAGSTTYQTIVLPAGGQPIGDPPEAIRKVSMPKEGGKNPPAKSKAGS